MWFERAGLRLALALGAASAGGAEAQAADLELGAWLGAECATCHSSSGANDGIPPITGWPPEAFVAVMEAYRAKERDNVTMQVIAARLTDEDIAALAAWFETLGD